MLNAAASLRHALVERCTFDPSNQTHLESLDVFLRTGNWGDVQFYPELPFVEVPITVLTKFAQYHREVQAESTLERAARLATKDLTKNAVESKEAHIERLAIASQLVKDSHF